MKIIINTANLRKGGALQVASSLIDDLRSFDKHQFYIFLSPAMSMSMDKKKFSENIVFFDCSYPSKFFFKAFHKNLVRLEKKIKPDGVFTVFGPSYWKPQSPHITGFANGLYLFDDLPFYKKMKFLSKIKEIIRRNYHRYLLKDDSTNFIVETKDVRSRLSLFLNIDRSRVSIVPNAYHTVFNEEIKKLNLLPHKEANEFRFITISSFYEHKNLELINKIIPLLEKENLSCKFILTIPKKSFEKYFDHKSAYLLNVGPVNINQCPYLYSNADALFLPTLVECFSVSYLEAMKSKIPIVTSDYNFSKTICGDAALYFDPFDEKDTLENIKAIITHSSMREDLVRKGEKKLKTYPSSFSRTESYIEECEKFFNKKRRLEL